ncbi:hypothetical protein [Carboxydothermus pertinax]|uniref:hypothetical protein n=1 Tax=Carboxydothermus pertinax TaxID=870242 RepID=UPI00096A2428|nr:hypothetical protein [Carboxydothermus pertinax]
MVYPSCFLGFFPESCQTFFLIKTLECWQAILPEKLVLKKTFKYLPQNTVIIDSLDFLIEAYLKIYGQPIYLYLTPKCRWLWPYLLESYRGLSFAFYYKPFRKIMPYIAIGELSGLRALTQNSPKPYAYYSLDF